MENIEIIKTGVIAQQKTPSTMERVEKYLIKKYHFRFNVVTGKVEYKAKTGAAFQAMTDYLINSLIREVIKAGVPCSSTMLRNILMSNFTPKFNPFQEYLEGLPPWDNQTDYIQQLSQTVNTTNDSLWKTCFRKWIVAMVGSLVQDHVINHTVIVFSGHQGIGKTTWLINLVPQSLKEYCFSGTINPGNKDTLIQLSECMLINLDELENLNRSELGTMKEMITKSSIRIRRPYGYSTETMPRRASFAGSVNGKEFLSDTTGSRRFLCFEATSINYHHEIQLENVYAQALHLFQNNFQFWFNPDEVEAINKNNEQYRCMTVEEELLLAYFEPCEPDEADCLFSTTELVNWFSLKVKMNVTDSAKQKLGKALRAGGFQRIKKQGRYVYALKEKDIEHRVSLHSFGAKTFEFENF